MSSLWTPGGEVPVNKDGGGDSAAAASSQQEPPSATPGEPTEEEIRAAYEQMQKQLLEAPAADVIARETVAIYELAALHLGQPEPRLDEARLAIDAVAGIIDAVGDRLGPAGQQLAEGIHQLRLAYVERSERTSGPARDPAQPASSGTAEE